MAAVQSLQRHICALFLASAVITSILVIRQKNAINYKSSLNPVRDYSVDPHNIVNELSLLGKVSNNATIIHVLGLFELSTKWGERTEGLSELQAARLAIEHVNDLAVIPDHKLKLLFNDTKCDPGVGIDTFFHAIYTSNQTIAILLGSSCSNVTESLAHVVPYWNILQVSFGSTSPSLSDRKKFPLFFRTIAPDSSHNSAKIDFVRHFRWNVVATLSQSEDEFLLPINSLIAELESRNISCYTTLTFSTDNFKDQLRVLKESDVRIVIASLSVAVAPKIFCEVFNLEMFGENGYVWILQERGEDWWTSGGHCSKEELLKAVEGMIFVNDYVVADNGTTISGIDEDVFLTLLSPNNTIVSKFARATYDAIWAVALSLRDVKLSSSAFNFSYKNTDLAIEFVRRMDALSFMGISGPVKFIGADRIGRSILRQLRDGKVNDVAVYDSHENYLNFRCESCKEISWGGAGTPVARRILKLSLLRIPKLLFYSVVLISIVGILTCLAFLYFNLYFRRAKTVKISSPKLNNVAVFGCVLVYMWVIFLGVDSSTSVLMRRHFDRVCSVRVYLLSAGFSLAFGSMFARTYRIHRIFTCHKANDKLLKDQQLIALILIPLLIDAIILSLWIMIDPMQRHLHNLTLEISPENRAVVYQPQVEECRSHNTGGWYIALYGYKSLILIMGAFMAWKTRHVKVQALNDSQYIGICVYGAVFSAAITVLSNFISQYVTFSYLATAGSILACTTMTLFLLFLPKLRSVVFRQVSENTSEPDPVMESMGLKMEYNTRRFIANDPREQILRLEIQNKVYKSELANLDREIARLERQLDDNNSDDSDPIFTITINDQPRCSWPSNMGRSIKRIDGGGKSQSEKKLDGNFLGKMKRYVMFDSFRRISSSDPCDFDSGGDCSYVKFNPCVAFNCRSDELPRSSSDNNINQ